MGPAIRRSGFGSGFGVANPEWRVHIPTVRHSFGFFMTGPQAFQKNVVRPPARPAKDVQHFAKFAVRHRRSDVISILSVSGDND
jgi:hypothetical protein